MVWRAARARIVTEAAASGALAGAAGEHAAHQRLTHRAAGSGRSPGLRRRRGHLPEPHAPAPGPAPPPGRRAPPAQGARPARGRTPTPCAAPRAPRRARACTASRRASGGGPTSAARRRRDRSSAAPAAAAAAVGTRVRMVGLQVHAPALQLRHEAAVERWVDPHASPAPRRSHESRVGPSSTARLAPCCSGTRQARDGRSKVTSAASDCAYAPGISSGRIRMASLLAEDTRRSMFGCSRTEP